MNELQAAIEAAWLPEPTNSTKRMSYFEWEGPRYSVQVTDDGQYLAQVYAPQLPSKNGGVPVVISGAERFATPAEACAKVKEWMDEQ